MSVEESDLMTSGVCEVRCELAYNSWSRRRTLSTKMSENGSVAPVPELRVHVFSPGGGEWFVVGLSLSF